MTSSKKLLLGGSIVFILLLLFLFMPKATIRLSSMDGSFYLREDVFSIEWIHSVEKELWVETFERRGDELYLVHTKFKTFGAGTPSDGEVVQSTDGFVHMDLNRKMEDFQVVVSRNVETTISTTERTYLLYEQLDDYEIVSIDIQKIPLWRYLRGE